MKTLLLCGDGPTLWDDLDHWWGLPYQLPPHDICTINRATLKLPCAPTFAFTYHLNHYAEQVARWDIPVYSVRRPDRDYANDFPQAILENIPADGTGGSSSLIATKLAVTIWGYDKVVLAGVPLTDHYFGDFFKDWARAYHYLAPHVRAISGNLRAFLFDGPHFSWFYKDTTP